MNHKLQHDAASSEQLVWNGTQILDVLIHSPDSILILQCVIFIYTAYASALCYSFVVRQRNNLLIRIALLVHHKPVMCRNKLKL